ncbi:NAD(P)-dependent oxidoreductase [Anaerobacillus alkaliphilus]|uniref:NAD(P)-dependent oxidoreductase n=1 Tax=Anaerobacillus alkaliphilus TaxID=1548597 RepID=A0A4Q0VZF4_9BACI|nr:NAD(P)-binding oxidoreductase [Anaerobacillus alkaliphilus]RXJ04496.1 NAD(P)-dependent oxidoreductase [Anaerobacillus alkaliphilus]
MTILVVGATGETGQLVVKQLLDCGEKVRVIVRYPDKLSETILSHQNISIITVGNVLQINKLEMRDYVKDCDAVISCLGHNLTLRGIFGPPFKLVTDVTKLICHAIKENKPQRTIKYILMNTTGNSNKNQRETVSLAEKCVLGIIRLLVPPHRDNEKAADYLRVEIGQDNLEIEWIAVRPDSLLNLEEVTKYSIFPSPIRSAIFNPGKTSRINVAHFMSELIINEELWEQWKGQMPVIYNENSVVEGGNT